MKIVFVPSAQFTGTHFALSFLSCACKYQSSLVQVRACPGLSITTGVGTTCFKSHLNLVGGLRKIFLDQWLMSVKNGWDGFIGIAQSHFGNCKGFMSFDQVDLLSGDFSTLVPVRDPLRVLASVTARGGADGANGGNVDSTLASFSFMATLWARKRRGISWLPVDLVSELPSGGRASFLDRVSRSLGLDFDMDLVANFGEKWPGVGTWTDYVMAHRLGGHFCSIGDTLKKRLEDGDAQGVARAIPYSFNQLRKREDEFRPFLDGLGYKNLIWWS